MSTMEVSRMGLPLSMDSMVASSSAFSSMTSAILFSRAARSLAVQSLQAGKAAQAAFTAASTSSLVACAHSASFSPVAGLVVTKVLPSEAGTHCPLM